MAEGRGIERGSLIRPHHVLQQRNEVGPCENSFRHDSSLLEPICLCGQIPGGKGHGKGCFLLQLPGPSEQQAKRVLCMLPRASKQCRKEGHSAPSSSCKVKLPSEQYLISVPAVLSTSWLAQLVVTTLGGRQAPDAPPRPMP